MVISRTTLPFFKQRTNYYCGPAVLQMILKAHGVRLTQDTIALEAKTTREYGTKTEDMVRFLRGKGFVVVDGNGKTIADIERALARGDIVIVCYMERHLDWGHYSSVAGIEHGRIDLLDPAEKDGSGLPFPLDEFESRWRDPAFTKTDHWTAFVSKALK